jgi:hypothetical protein
MLLPEARPGVVAVRAVDLAAVRPQQHVDVRLAARPDRRLDEPGRGRWGKSFRRALFHFVRRISNGIEQGASN